MSADFPGAVIFPWSMSELLRAIFFAKCWWPVSVVEQYLEGCNYRVVVAQGEIMSAIRRYPPFVDGDGGSTIEELIDKENIERKKMQLMPVIHPIAKDRRIVKFLKKQNLELGSVIPQDTRVHLFNRVALAPGGVVEIVDKKRIPLENQELFLQLLKEFNANILGIDAIFKEGIEKSHKVQDVIFLEVNSRPYLKMHDFPRYGGADDLSSYYNNLEKLAIDDQDVF